MLCTIALAIIIGAGIWHTVKWLGLRMLGNYIDKAFGGVPVWHEFDERDDTMRERGY